MRSNAIKTRIAPLIKANAHINFPNQYWNELEKTLANSAWLKVKHLDKSTVEYTAAEIAKVSLPLLVLKTSYELSPNCQIFAMQTKARLYLNDIKKPDYFSLNTYYSDQVGTDNETGEAAIELWAANHALIYRNTLAEGIEQNLRMLLFDLLDSPANPKTETGAEIRLQIRSPISGWTLKVEGLILKHYKNRIIMREKKGGNLFSIAFSIAGLEE